MMEVIAQAPAGGGAEHMDWSRFLENASPAGLVAFVVLFVFVRLIPAREQAHREAMTEARKDYLEHLSTTRTEFLAQIGALNTSHNLQMNNTREAFLLEINRQRDFFKSSIDSVNDMVKTSIDRMKESLDRQAVVLSELAGKRV